MILSLSGLQGEQTVQQLNYYLVPEWQKLHRMGTKSLQRGTNDRCYLGKIKESNSSIFAVIEHGYCLCTEFIGWALKLAKDFKDYFPKSFLIVRCDHIQATAIRTVVAKKENKE